MNTCKKCGAELKNATQEAGQWVCGYCGTKLDDSLVEQSLQEDSVLKENLPSSPETEAPILDAVRYQFERPKPQQPIGKSGCMLWFGVFWTLFSLVFLLIGIFVLLNEKREYDLLTNEGQIVQGVVTDLTISSGEDSDTYYVHYRFNAPVKGDLRQFDDKISVSWTLYSSLEKGQKISIIYAISNPSVSDLEMDLKPPSLIFPLVFGGLGLIFTLIGLYMVSTGIEGLSHQRQLQRDGRVTRGVVFDRWTESDDDSTSYLVAFAFQVNHPEYGQEWIKRAEDNRPAYKALRPGKSVQVRYLHADPEICQLDKYRG